MSEQPPEFRRRADALPGLDLKSVTARIERECPGLLTGRVQARLLTGGRSNLTYELHDEAGSSAVLRRPPFGSVLESAHDMAREVRVQRALATTAVPVPAVHLYCEDTEVTGAPFYVMSRLEGDVVRSAAELDGRAESAGTALVEVLATLHDLAPADVGLAGFGRPEGFAIRQVARWGRQLDAGRTHVTAALIALRAALEARSAHLADHSGAAVVHGDYRLDNVLLGPRGQIIGVLDWEMATLGDPLTDVATLAAYTGISAHGGGEIFGDAARAEGFPTPAELLNRYAELRALPLHDLDFYLALAHFKIAVIAEGIDARYRHGQTVGAGFETIGAHVTPIAEAGLATL